MNSPTLMLLSVMFATTAAAAQEKPDATPTTVDELIASYEKDMNGIRAALDKEKDEKKTAALIERFRRTPTEYLTRMKKAVLTAKGTPAEPRGLAWMLRKTRDRSEKEALLQRLLKDFRQSEAMGEVCQELSYSSREDALELLEDQLAKNPHRKVKGQACYAMAVRIKQGFGRRRDPTPAARERIESLLERVLKEYADLPHFYRGTLGAAARIDLFELRRLAIGAIAPDIEGKDLNGVAFKLSDYRGKVVLLDFWGHW